MPEEYKLERPRWLRDLMRFLPLKAQFVLSGNVHDLQLGQSAAGAAIPQPLVALLSDELRVVGYSEVVVYDPVNGFKTAAKPGGGSQTGQELLASLGLTVGPDGTAPAGIEAFSEALRRMATRPASEAPVALLVDFASRFIARPDALSATESSMFSRALVLSHQSRPRPYGTPVRPFMNSVIWIVEKEGDLPDWLVIDNPRLRHIPVAKPDHRYRRAMAQSLLQGIQGADSASAEVREQALDELVEGTEGLLLLDLNSIFTLCRTEGIGLTRLGDAVRRYKVGVTEDPWALIDREKIKDGAAFVRERVRGQDPAVTHVLDIIKRAVTGIGAPRRGNRPRGVVFLAGPTGVGKTELAKTITQLLFGDDSAYIRFDMSEFSAEHSDQRLIGAPPGYVGYDVGGELTNAVRERPFSVVLFDEIEKAHPRILDKFLQVLDDGVLTSGRGDRVYFSEAFIVFTSNLGIYRLEADGSRVPNVTPDESYATIRAKVMAEIQGYFTATLNRPELLNRIGDNILVFDYIRPDIALQIFDQMVQSIQKDVQAGQQVEVVIAAAARRRLAELCLSDLANGGRGIRNKLETHLINPLARAVFDTGVTSGSVIEIEDLVPQESAGFRLQISSRSVRQ